jgi:triosephosphate isomerase (TIM)
LELQSMRQPLVTANWKMNLALVDARGLLAELLEKLASVNAWSSRVEVCVCPPFPYLFPVAKALAGSGVSLGAQNLYFEAAGAFTGEVSAAMIADTKARYVILGHSERRHTISHHEDDREINLKVRAALTAGLTPILCVGETLAQRDANQTLDVLSFQTAAGLAGVAAADAPKCVIAYEPVWAIGTGRNATPQQAQDAHAHIRREVARLCGSGPAESLRILYGGSVKPDNASAIFTQRDVDGGLIGGASLKAASFFDIVVAAMA